MIQVFWDVTPCLAEQFLTVQRMVVAWSSGSSSLHSTWTAWPWRWRHYFHSEHQETLIQWHSVTTPKTWLLSNTAANAQHPTM